MENEYDCLVLGGGIAGIAAARYLADQACSVLLLEGSNRIGGRIHTLSSGAEDFDGLIELGAEYIHRPPGRVPLWNEINDHGLQYSVVPKRDHGLMYWPEAPPQARLRSIRDVSAGLSLIGAKFFFARTLFYAGKDLSAKALIQKHKLNGIGRGLVEMAFSGQLPGSLDNISVKGHRSDRILKQLAEINDFAIDLGNSELLSRMSQGLEIQLGANVRKIIWGPQAQQKVVVQTEDGRTFRAKTAICTFSVNMLKSEQLEFSPKLPEQKQTAISLIKMGDIAKVIVRFERKFWPENATMIHFPHASRKACRTYFHDSFLQKTKAPTLTGFFMGTDADKILNLSDRDVLQAMFRDLDECFPDAAPTARYMRHYLRKHWSQDPFALGGFSYLEVLASGSPRRVTRLRRDLADPRSTLPLFWAGEATSIRTQPASMHGAHLSGLDAARMVRRHLHSGRSPRRQTRNGNGI